MQLQNSKMEIPMDITIPQVKTMVWHFIIATYYCQYSNSPPLELAPSHVLRGGFTYVHNI